jgi:hypothetical protein
MYRATAHGCPWLRRRSRFSGWRTPEKDTVVKFDTTTNKQLGRYKTWLQFPTACTSDHCGNAYGGAAPSRTAVDSNGNVYVANRHFDGRPPSIVKILASGGIDRNGNTTIETSTDADNNGIVTYAEMTPAPVDNNPANGRLDRRTHR